MAAVTMKTRHRQIPESRLLLILSLVVGLCSGAAAVVLEKLIHLIQHMLSPLLEKSDTFNIAYIILPGVGMFLAMLIVKYIIRDKIGHGVTKVLVAVSRNESVIKPHNMWSSLLTSSLTIGFGGSVGAEAPIVYTGSAIGSNLGRYFGLSHRSITVLVGCGAAGAVAGIFKAPLAGVLFTLEILLFNISMTSMTPLLLSTVSATVVSYIFLGDNVPFACTLDPFAIGRIPFYVILGIFCALVSLYFQGTTLWLEDKLKHHFRNPYLKWLFCATGLGILVLLFPPLFAEGYSSLTLLLNGQNVDVNGISPISFILGTPWGVPVFFALIMLAKVFSMTFTNAGGGVGGTFGPTLFVGGLAGFVMARSVNLAFPSVMLPEQNFVLVGMAGLMAGVMQAPMTAIFLIAEITGGYELFLPLIICSTISYGTTRFKEKYSIYTKRIAQSGDLLTHDSDQAVLTLLKLDDFIERDFATVDIEASLGTLVKAVSRSRRNIFPVIDSKNRFQGYVLLDDIRRDMFKSDCYDTLRVFNFVRSAPAYIIDTDPMDEVMRKFESTEAWNLPVVDKDRTYIGFISKSKIFTAYRDELKELSHD